VLVMMATSLEERWPNIEIACMGRIPDFNCELLTTLQSYQQRPHLTKTRRRLF
jgi:hypothetical protein